MKNFFLSYIKKTCLVALIFLSVFTMASCNKETLKNVADVAAEGFDEIINKPAAPKKGQSEDDSGLEQESSPPPGEDAVFTPRHMDIVAADALKMAKGFSSIRNESMDTILEYMENQGLCAYDNISCTYPMTSIGLVKNFFQDIESGNGASLTVYEITSSERLIRHDLISTDAWDYSVQTILYWRGDVAEITFQEERELEEIRFTDSENILYTRILPRNPESKLSHDGYVVPTTMLRTKALDPKCKEYEEAYLKPLAYQWGNLYSTDWAAGELSSLNYGEIFAGICGYNMANIRGDITVSASEFEDKFLSLLPISSEELRLYGEYDSGSHTYQAHLPANHQDIDIPFPQPEVTGYRENTDNSLTLFVNLVFLDMGTDCALSHELTLMPSSGGGFKYISNRVIGEH